jgi:hypothetical protein
VAVDARLHRVAPSARVEDDVRLHEALSRRAAGDSDVVAMAQAAGVARLPAIVAHNALRHGGVLNACHRAAVTGRVVTVRANLTDLRDVLVAHAYPPGNHDARRHIGVACQARAVIDDD